MKVIVGLIFNEEVIGAFETSCIPNVGELIFDQITRKHYKVVERAFGFYSGEHIKEMDVTLWCEEVK